MQFRVYGRQQNPYTIESRIMGGRIILTADEENIKAILATQFADYGKGEVFNQEWHDFLGDSIFTTDGPKWHEARHLLRPQFIKNRVSDLHIFERHVAVLLPMLERGSQSQGPADADDEVELVDLFFRFTLDAATEFLLGTSVDSLLNPRDRFASAFAAVQHTQSLIARTGPLNILVPRRAFHAGLKVMEEVISPFIDAALRLSPAELTRKADDDAAGYNFLYALAAYTRDRTVLRDQIAAVLLAGRDTTACTLSWLFDALARNADIVRKLRREIAATVGMDRIPTYADLKGMRYLQHTINETLRLYPIVPFNVRVALRDTTLPRGGGKDGDQPMAVLKGTPVGYSTLALQRREDIYPPVSETFPDLLEFVPERWEGWTPRPWTYVPFNGGPRICIGVSALILTVPLSYFTLTYWFCADDTGL